MTLEVHADPNAVVPQYQTLALDDEGDMAFPARWLYGLDAVAQGVQSTIRFIKGEWYQDRNLGTPWFEHALGKHQLTETTRMMRDMLALCDGVIAVVKVELAPPNSEREGALRWEVRAAGGRIVGEEKLPRLA